MLSICFCIGEHLNKMGFYNNLWTAVWFSHLDIMCGATLVFSYQLTKTHSDQNFQNFIDALLAKQEQVLPVEIL